MGPNNNNPANAWAIPPNIYPNQTGMGMNGQGTNSMNQNMLNNMSNGFAMNNQQTYSPQTMVQSSQPSFTGRYINEVTEIKPNEVPMDGSISLFPTADLTSIYLKLWTPEGKIATIRYEAVAKEDSDQNANDNFKEDIYARLEKLETAMKEKSSKKSKAKEED